MIAQIGTCRRPAFLQVLVHHIHDGQARRDSEMTLVVVS